MLGVIAFNLNCPDDKVQFGIAQDGWKYKAILEELDNWLRNKIKHEGQDELLIVRDELSNFCAEENVTIWD